MYTTAQRVRARGGLCDSVWSDAALEERISLACAFIDDVTGQWFEVRSCAITLDGRGTFTLLVPIPIIEVTRIDLLDWPDQTNVTEVGMDAVAVYNRHLTEGLLNPDDRKNPRVAFTNTDIGRRTVYADKWPEGHRNVRLTGRFGYTERIPLEVPPYGRTPLLIREVCERLVLRELPAAPSGAGAGMDGYQYEAAMRAAGRVTREKVRDQEIEYAAPSAAAGNVGGIITGDPWIDMVLLNHRRPPRFRTDAGTGEDA